MATTGVPASVVNQVISNTSNVTYRFTPSASDLAPFIPHFIANAASFAFITIPEKLDNILHGGGSTIAEGTGNNSIISAAVSQGAAATPTRSTSSVPGLGETNAGPSSGGKMLNLLAFGQARSLDGIFRYVTSKWALSCFALAIILNRTQVFASPRRNVKLSWLPRTLLRLAPIYFLTSNTLSLLHAMRCQTSPDYSQINYGRTKRQGELDFSGDGGSLYYLSRILFWENDTDACRAVDMTPAIEGNGWIEHGSLSLLWPLFQSLCLGQFVETVACAIQGYAPMTETGMSIFEHSLAFAEAESGFSGLVPPSSGNRNGARRSEKDAAFILGRALSQQLNAPPEFLLLGVISSLNSLSSHLLGVFDLQSRYRLINTGIWGLCYMVSFLWGLFSVRPESGPDRVFLRFPTVCIVGFIPHLIIIAGILVCSVIYGLALMMCILSPPQDLAPLGLWVRFRWARDNMHVSDRLSNVMPLDMGQDFFSSLMRTGFAILTAASEAVYLLEYKPIGVPRWTWLEEERVKQLESLNHSTDPTRRRSIHVEPRVRSAETAQSVGVSGYGKEHSVTPANPLPSETGPGHGGDGVGHLQRGGRYIRAYKYVESIFWLSIECLKILVNRILAGAGFRLRPRWLKRPESDQSSQKPNDNKSKEKDYLDFWMISDDGILSLPKSNDVDVEKETRRRMQLSNPDHRAPTEEQLSKRLYDWWVHNGWFGELDQSGGYTTSTQEDEEDTTSMISMTDTSDAEEESSWELDAYSGRSTPTQDKSFPRHSRSPSPMFDHGLDVAHLASLLNPKDLDARQQAKILAHTLTASGITTRSRYQRANKHDRTKLLTSTRNPKSGFLAQEQEAELLETIIDARRSQAASSSRSSTQDRIQQDSDSSASGGAGMASCVVCHCSPRSVLVWPCRCLTTCEDCRVSLAMNNYTACVCCRRDVFGYSRLYVP